MPHGGGGRLRSALLPSKMEQSNLMRLSPAGFIHLITTWHPPVLLLHIITDPWKSSLMHPDLNTTEAGLCFTTRDAALGLSLLDGFDVDALLHTKTEFVSRMKRGAGGSCSNPASHLSVTVK